MKIAIFGDSFADDKINWRTQWQDVGPSWVDYLRTKHTVENFSLGGSCLYYSKKIFDNTNLDSYDKIIFVVTQSQRRYQVVNENDLDENKNWNETNSRTRMKFYFHKQNYLKTIHDFFVYMHNESDEYFHQLMIDDIKRKREDALILDYWDLLKISQQETDFWLQQGLDYYKHNDARKCHMCEENNLIFGQQVEAWIQGNRMIIDLDNYVLPSKPFQYYFR